MPEFDTDLGDTVRIEGPDQWYDEGLYVSYREDNYPGGESAQGDIQTKEGSQLDAMNFVQNRAIFEMELSKSGESRTHHLTGCRFEGAGTSGVGNSFKADWVNWE